MTIRFVTLLLVGVCTLCGGCAMQTRTGVYGHGFLYDAFAEPLAEGLDAKNRMLIEPFMGPGDRFETQGHGHIDYGGGDNHIIIDRNYEVGTRYLVPR